MHMCTAICRRSLSLGATHFIHPRPKLQTRPSPSPTIKTMTYFLHLFTLNAQYNTTAIPTLNTIYANPIP